MRNRCGRSTPVVWLLSLMAVVVTACGGGGDKVRVLGPSEKASDLTLTELVTTYIAGVLTTPVPDSIFTDPAKCDMGLSTSEVYFAPTVAADGDSSATCTVRPGQAVLLLPSANLCVDDGTMTDQALNDCLSEGWTLQSSALELDGNALSLDGYQVDTPITPVTLGKDNLFGAPEGTETKFAVRAQAVVVKGLPIGEHEVVLSTDFGNDSLVGTLTLTLVVEK